eukprot:TRINITY_DN363_c0_g4_i1.p1 TRINITY_DN363_c0_g4~~TRINITY_DN363_c0_g4_i1.p1  ORF type:complete len:335 (-),score=55.46 TRINITY_DN363_c0_g4_i1:161-1075(-)
MGSFFGGEREFTPSFFMDFENAQPADCEKEIYNQVQVVVEKQSKIMDKMKSYTGCTDLIQRAISQPTDENKMLCWNRLCPTVDTLKEFYIHAEELVKVFPLLMCALCGSSDYDHTFSTHQALTKQLASILDFAMSFDELKMSNPAISNDFSYYRRTITALKLHGRDTKVNVTDEMANKMSLFYAFPTPMLNVVKTCIQSDKIQVDKNRVIGGLSLMVSVCINLVDKRRFSDTKTLMYCLRAATGATILVDSIFEPGIFHPRAKKPPIAPRYILSVLKDFTEESTVNLINALKYNTKEAEPSLFE